MPRRFIKKYMPDHHEIKKHKYLQIFGDLLHDPNLWHLNRRSVSGAFAVGLFSAFVPIPFQMVLSAFIAILCRVNLPISVALVWISNPITMPPMFYACYKLGALIMQQEVRDIEFQLSYEWVSTQLDLIWEPFLLGCFIFGITSASLSYMAIRIFWRLHIIERLKQKRLRKKLGNVPK